MKMSVVMTPRPLTHALLLSLIMLGLIACGDDAPPSPTPTRETYTIRPIYDNSFFLEEYPVEILTRSTCQLLQNMTTTAEGHLIFENVTPQELLIFVVVDGVEYGGIIKTSDFKNGVTDINLSNYIDYSISEPIDYQQTYPANEEITLAFQVDIRDYPIEKTSLTLVNEDLGIEQQVSIDQSGMGTFALSIPNGRHELLVTFLNRSGQLIDQSVIVINTAQEFDAQLTYELVDCNGIHLSWQPYTGDDFGHYEIKYSFSKEENNDCGVLGQLKEEFEQSTTETTLFDYGSTEMVCVELTVIDNSGNPSSTSSITIPQPYDLGIATTGELRYAQNFANGTTLLSSFDYNSYQQQHCILASGATSSDCNFIGSDVKILDATWSDDHYIVAHQNGSSIDFTDIEGQVLSSVLAGEFVFELDILKGPYAVGNDITNGAGLVIIDRSQGTISATPMTIDGDLQSLIATPREDVFGTIVYNQQRGAFNLQMRKVNSTDDITTSTVISLGAEAFNVQESSANKEFTVLSNGKIIDLREEAPVVRSVLPAGVDVQFDQVLVGNEIAGFYDFNSRRVTSFDMRSAMQTATYDLCDNEKPLLILNNNELLTTRGVADGRFYSRVTMD